jgi:hypothetical protein
MLLQPDQQQWLAEFGVKRKAQTKLQAREDQKAALITKLMRDLQDQQEDLLTGTQQTVIKKGTKKDTQQTQDYIKRKQHKLFDVADQKKGYVLATAIDDKAKKPKFKEEEWNKLTGEQKHFQELQQAGRIVDTLARQMQTEVVKLDENGRPKTKVLVNSKTGKAKKDKNGKKKTKHVKGPLFTAEEIKEELYTPMVRAGLIPETNVPDEFSATKKMLDGSFKAYGSGCRGRRKGACSPRITSSASLSEKDWFPSLVRCRPWTWILNCPTANSSRAAAKLETSSRVSAWPLTIPAR